MPIRMYDLAGADGRRFSPFCWRIRLALAHKGLEVETIPLIFTEIPESPGFGADWRTLPTILDGHRTVTDSWSIAHYLEETYPDGAPLFAGEDAQAVTLFVRNWVERVIHPALIRLVLLDIVTHLDERDHAYFRESREKRFGQTIEDVQAGRDERLGDGQRLFDPVRAVLAEQPFLGGLEPRFADHILFGALQWPRIMSDFRILTADDTIEAWRLRIDEAYPGVADDASRYY